MLAGMHVFMKGKCCEFCSEPTCYTATMTADKVQAPIGGFVNITVQLVDNNCGQKAKPLQAGGVVVPILVSNAYYWSAEGVNVSSTVQAISPMDSPSKATTQQAIESKEGVIHFLHIDDTSLQAKFALEILELGCGSVTLFGADGSLFLQPPSLLINCRDSQGAVSEIVLVPHKAYR
jgi:hypothetical protein